MRKTPATAKAGVIRGGRGRISLLSFCVLVPLVGAPVGAEEVAAGELFESETEVDGEAEPVTEVLCELIDVLDLSEGADVEEDGSEDD